MGSAVYWTTAGPAASAVLRLNFLRRNHRCGRGARQGVEMPHLCEDRSAGRPSRRRKSGQIERCQAYFRDVRRSHRSWARAYFGRGVRTGQSLRAATPKDPDSTSKGVGAGDHRGAELVLVRHESEREVRRRCGRTGCVQPGRLGPRLHPARRMSMQMEPTAGANANLLPNRIWARPAGPYLHTAALEKHVIALPPLR